MPDELLPPELVTRLDITATMDVDGVWHVQCPQWKFSQEGRNLTRITALLAADIEAHIDQHQLNEPAWYTNEKKLAETVLGLRDHNAEQAKRLGARTRYRIEAARRTLPKDDGTRTPGEYWQKS